MLKRDGTDVTVDNACEATSGTWVSPYDGKEWKDESDLQIDHMVPLKNAWDVRLLFTPLAPSQKKVFVANKVVTVWSRKLDSHPARRLRQRYRASAAVGCDQQRQREQRRPRA